MSEEMAQCGSYLETLSSDDIMKDSTSHMPIE